MLADRWVFFELFDYLKVLTSNDSISSISSPKVNSKGVIGIAWIPYSISLYYSKARWCEVRFCSRIQTCTDHAVALF
jgi:hypothetical protein